MADQDEPKTTDWSSVTRLGIFETFVTGGIKMHFDILYLIVWRLKLKY